MKAASPRAIPPPRRVLVIPLRFIGDTVLSVPLIRALRQAFPDARIETMASRLTAPLLANCPYLDAVFPEPKGVLACVYALKGFDTVFLLRKSVSMALLARLASVKTLVGYDKQRFPQPIGYRRWGCLLDRAAPYPSLRTQTPQAEHHLGLLRACGVQARDTTLALWESEDDHESMASILTEHGLEEAFQQGDKLAAFHASSASHGKAFPAETFLPAIEALLKAGMTVVCTGTTSDRAFYDAIAARLEECPAPARWLNLAGQTTLGQSIALLRRAHILLSVDSGPLHLAAAAQTPRIVGVFGPTNERQWGVYSPHSRFFPVYEALPCRPCYAKICSHNACRLTLDPARVKQAVQSALADEAGAS
ncbi:MAG: glycosyltransferase family 9 protein [Vampirovibrionales bacterium]|nr:glycosyltransferase family 9 protein [Vampirovibrionales bacterium]